MAEIAAGRLRNPAPLMGGGLLFQAWRIAQRELRGGFNGFRILLACLFLGVAAIAGVGSLSQAMLSGLENNGRELLGGDVELRLIHNPASERALSWLRDNSQRFSRTAELRAMARSPEPDSARRLVELKAVDSSYPLFGSLRTDPPEIIPSALARQDGVWGALVDPGLLERLNVGLGDRLTIGELDYQIRGTTLGEPDRVARAFTLGPRVMVAYDSLPESGLQQPGSLIYYQYRLELAGDADARGWASELEAEFPNAGWRVRDLRNAAPGINRFVSQVSTFMTLVGLTALLVGGVGVANAVKAYMDRKRPTIATLKCLGASSLLIFTAYLLQLMVLAAVGILAGLAVGAVVPFAVGPLLSEHFNFPISRGIHPAPLGLAALFGILIALAFSLWPLARAQQTPAGSLFRELVQHSRVRMPLWAIVAIVLCGIALAATAVLGTQNPRVAAGFVAGAVIAMLGFRIVAEAIMRLARRLPRARRPVLRLAVANLYRPGATTVGVVTSLGLGLTVLIAIALIEGSISRQIVEEMPEEAPGFYFIDIQPDQVEDFERLVLASEGVSRIERVPMLRGRITRVNGLRPEEVDVPSDARWVFRGDRGITWSDEPPPDARLTRGSWWPSDYAGPPLVSLDANIAEHLDLAPGDTLSVNVLGREIEAEIANLRVIDWSELTINFVMVFSPGMLEAAPQTHIATVHLDPAQEDALERAVTDAFPNVSSVRVKDALASFAEMLANVSLAVALTASVTLLAGTLVLAGAVAAGHQRRVYDSIVLKVLGATRRDIARTFLLEYGLIGLLTAVIAIVFGVLAAWLVMEQVMNAPFAMQWTRVALTAVGATAVTLAFGFAGTLRALSHKAAPHLRND